MSDEQAEPKHDEIARRAYEISQGEDAGSADENWHRAERELRAERDGGASARPPARPRRARKA
jgi:hypothetical protein